MTNNEHNFVFLANPYQNYYLDPYSRIHNKVLISIYEIKGEGMREKIEFAWRELIKRHDGLRLSFYQKEGKTYQIINQHIDFKINYYLKRIDKSFSELIEEFCSPIQFDLEKPPLFRVSMFYRNINHYWMVLEIHHAILDGFATAILFNDLFAYTKMQTLVIEPATHYDCSEFLQNYLYSEAMEKQRQYWESKLLVTPLNFKMPTDYQSENIKHIVAKPPLKLLLSGELYRNIDKFIRKVGMTRFVFFSGVFSLLLYEYSLSREIVYVSVIPVRKQTELRRVVSTLVNFITLIFKIDENENITQYFKKHLKEIFTSMANMEYPFSLIHKKINANQPIDGIIFLYQNFIHNASFTEEDSSASINLVHAKSFGSSRIFRLEVIELIDAYYCGFSYNGNLFKPKTIAQFLQRYRLLIEQIVTDKNLFIKDLIQPNYYKEGRVMNLDYSERLHDIPWQNIKLVIFDLDGTLYSMPKFQIDSMAFAEQLQLSQQTIKILFSFSSLIDKSPALCQDNMENYLYSLVSQELNVEINVVKDVIDNWHEILMPLLPKAKLAYIDEFFRLLTVDAVKKTVYSNVPVRNKLMSLNLEAELVVTSFDSQISQLKPTATAISYILNQFNVNRENCLVIGDQYELDGISAIEAKVPFVILPNNQFDLDQFYPTMINSYYAKKTSASTT